MQNNFIIIVVVVVVVVVASFLSFCTLKSLPLHFPYLSDQNLVRTKSGLNDHLKFSFLKIKFPIIKYSDLFSHT